MYVAHAFLLNSRGITICIQGFPACLISKDTHHLGAAKFLDKGQVVVLAALETFGGVKSHSDHACKEESIRSCLRNVDILLLR